MAYKKIVFRLILLGIAAGAVFIAYKVFGANTEFEQDKKILYINTGTSFYKLPSQLERGGFIKNYRTFRRLSQLMGYDKNIRPGRYVIEKGTSIYSLIKLLKSGSQTPVPLLMGKLRTREDLIKKIRENFECDSIYIASFLNSNDSLAQYGLDTNTAMSIVMPARYEILWTSSFNKIFNTLNDARKKFWTEERKQKAAGLGLTEAQVYTLASIVEEETNKEEDKGKIASVYLNRLNTGMKLGADPTIKFALKDFDLRRIYEKHLFVQSPYNTYMNKGLPPGPICTATEKTIDAVLNAPATNYLYFVAKPEFDGYSNFAATYEEHLRYAKAYQQALDSLMRRKAEGRE